MQPDLSQDIREKLEAYHALLLKWNPAINLVSKSTIKDAWRRHFVDSIQIEQYVPDDAKIYADLGCGGGFPGLVVAIMRPDLDVHLVESDERKGQFMRTAIRETSAKNATVHTKRVEAATQDMAPDFITARALAALDKLFDLCLPWAENNSALELCFMKGARAEEEIAQARQSYSFDLESHSSITDVDARILCIRNLAAIK